MPEEEQMKQVMPEHFGKNIHPGNKKILWLIVFLLLIVIGGVAGLYLINQEEALNNELTSVHLNDGPKAKRVNGVVPGNDDEDGSYASIYKVSGYDMQAVIPKDWNVATQMHLLNNNFTFGVAINSIRMTALSSSSIVFPEILEFNFPWEIALMHLNPDEGMTEEDVLFRVRSEYLGGVDETVVETEGGKLYSFDGIVSSEAFGESREINYLLVTELNGDTEYFFASVDDRNTNPEYVEEAKIIMESLRFIDL